MWERKKAIHSPLSSICSIIKPMNSLSSSYLIISQSKRVHLNYTEHLELQILHETNTVTKQIEQSYFSFNCTKIWKRNRTFAIENRLLLPGVTGGDQFNFAVGHSPRDDLVLTGPFDVQDDRQGVERRRRFNRRLQLRSLLSIEELDLQKVTV